MASARVVVVKEEEKVINVSCFFFKKCMFSFIKKINNFFFEDPVTKME